MQPPEEWLSTLDFYLLVNSGFELTASDFSEDQLLRVWLEHPGMDYASLDAASLKLVLEFQAKRQDTEGERMNEDGPLPVSMLDVPADF